MVDPLRTGRTFTRHRTRSEGGRLASLIADHGSFAIFLLLIIALALLGGSARSTVASLPLLRPVLALGVAGFLLLPPSSNAMVAVHMPLRMLGIVAAIIGFQLIPLPPAIWLQLPGHAAYAAAADLAGQPQPWRPVSLVPILTLNSLMALLAPLAMLVALTRLSVGDEQRVAITLILLGGASAMLGLLQATLGEGSIAYLYAYARGDLATGVFANHNHQAVFLAGLLPVLAWWACSPATTQQVATRRRWIAVATGFFFVLSIVLTASRSGLIVAALEMPASAWLALRTRPTENLSPRWRGVALLVGICLLVSVLGLASGRENVFDRLQSLNDASSSLRKAALPITIELAKAFFPLGSGFGTFDTIFRAAEPDTMLRPSYFNNAHNDLIELAITGGAPALLLLAVLLVWLGRRILSARTRLAADPMIRLAQPAGLLLVGAFLLGSLSDYPLRTPFAAAVFAIGCGFAGGRRSREKPALSRS